MKKLSILFVALWLVGCSGGEEVESNVEPTSPDSGDQAAVVEESETEHETEPYSSMVKGKWRVTAIDGNTEVMDQVFDFQDNGDCVQTIQGQVMPAGSWSMDDDNGMLTLHHAEGDGKDQLKILELDLDLMKWNWEGKDLGVLELKRVTE